MRIEQIAAPPPELSPQMRYASLHRTVENGFATDRTWSEMIQVCIELRKHDEALDVFHRLVSPSQRARARSVLARRGLVPPDPDQDEELRVTESDMHPSIREQLSDSFRFLFEDHMPLTVIVATMTFPIVVGLGGMLTAGSRLFLLPAIALIPALSVLGLIGALGRRILLEASQGLDDPPQLPAVGQLAREALRFIADWAVLGAIFLGPGVLMTFLKDVGTPAALATLALGGMLLPMAVAIRQLTDDWHALHPQKLFPAIVRCGTRYLAVAGVILLLFVPAALSVYLTLGSHLYLVVAVIGPLSVVPLFIASRLMGQLIHYQRLQLADLIDLPTNRCATRSKAAARPAMARAAVAARFRTAQAGFAPKKSATAVAAAAAAAAAAATARARAAKARSTVAASQQRRRAPLAAPTHPEANRTQQRRAAPPPRPSQATRGAQPATGARLSLGARPSDNGTRPSNNGARPTLGPRPTLGARPDDGARPAPGARPTPTTRPGGQPPSRGAAPTAGRPAPAPAARRPAPAPAPATRHPAPAARRPAPAPAPGAPRPAPGRSPVAQQDHDFGARPPRSRNLRATGGPSLEEIFAGEEIPDLTKLPGVQVVTGEQRERAGAAAGSRTPRRP